jgi:hypothetical protein
VANRDLWETVCAEGVRHRIEWEWVESHAEDPFNERCHEPALIHSLEMPRRTLSLLPLVSLLAACGGTNTKQAVAKVEAHEILQRCTAGVTAATHGATKPVPCHLRELSHLTGTLWKVRLSVPPYNASTSVCVTFDAAKYLPGSRQAQNYASCP